MGSKSRSRTASTQNTSDVTTSLGDNRVTESGNIGGNVTLGKTGGDVSVTTTDLGAIEESFGLAGMAIEGVGAVASDGFDFAEDVSLNAQNNAFNLAGSSLAANALLANETLRRESLITSQVFDVLGEASAGFDDVSKALNANAASTGNQLAGLADATGSNTTKIILFAAAAAVVIFLVRSKK